MLLPELLSKQKVERRACFLVGIRNERTLLRPRDWKVFLVSRETSQGHCCLGGSWTPHLATHHRVTCPRRPRGPAPRSAARVVGERCHAPVNDSFFMKKEQANGNLCCVESAREKACQVSSDPWTLCNPTPRSSRVKDVKTMQDPGPSGVSIASRLFFQPFALPSAVFITTTSTNDTAH